MSYQDFCNRMHDLAKQGKAKVICGIDKDRGEYYAVFDQSKTVVRMAFGSLKMTVNYGSGHCAQVAV